MAGVSDSGVYLITCTVSGRVYVGSSVSISCRWRYHRYQLRKMCHGNAHLQRAWNKYGESAFEFSVLIKCPVDELLDIEQRVLDSHKIHGSVFNIADDCAASARGAKRSPKTCARISMAKKGVPGPPKSPETRARLSRALMGRVFTDEHRAKISLARAGRSTGPMSPETRAKISAAHTGKTGKPHTAESRSKMSAALKGRSLTAAHRAKISQGNKLRWEKWRLENNP